MPARRVMLAVAVLTFVAAGHAAAQEERPQNAARQAVVRQFERNAPALGKLLPDLELYDARGKPVRLAELRGSHTVLVFGCLT